MVTASLEMMLVLWLLKDFMERDGLVLDVL